MLCGTVRPTAGKGSGKQPARAQPNGGSSASGGSGAKGGPKRRKLTERGAAEGAAAAASNSAHLGELVNGERQLLCATQIEPTLRAHASRQAAAMGDGWRWVAGRPFEERELMSQLKYEQGRERKPLDADSGAPTMVDLTADALSRSVSSHAPPPDAPYPPRAAPAAITAESRLAAPLGGTVEFGTGEAPPLAPPRAWAREELDEWLQQPEQVSPQPQSSSRPCPEVHLLNPEPYSSSPCDFTPPVAGQDCPGHSAAPVGRPSFVASPLHTAW